MEHAKKISIEIAFAKPDHQMILKLDVTEGCTVKEAILQSAILQRYPEINWTTHATGIFGNVVAETTALQAGDRIEIYRPLHRDPKQARLLRTKA